MGKITLDDLQTLSAEEQEVYEAMKDLEGLEKAHMTLLIREMKKRGHSERAVNTAAETLHLLGLIFLCGGEKEGQFEIINP